MSMTPLFVGLDDEAQLLNLLLAISLIYMAVEPVPFLREETVHPGPDREGGVRPGD
jgi:hypothetical protein